MRHGERGEWTGPTVAGGRPWYKGRWKDDMKHGKGGVFSTPDQHHGVWTYEGAFKRDRAHGAVKLKVEK